jgi:L-fuconolactonase
VNATTSGIVDAHVHLWDRGRFQYEWLANESGVLKYSFLPPDLDEALDLSNATVSKVVVVQADCRDDQSLDEAQWFESLADAGAPIAAIVANAPLERGENCRADVEQLASVSRVSGVRRLLQDRPTGFATSPGFVEGVRLLADYGLTMDLCIRQHQLGEVTELVSRCPDVTFVLDHLGKPVVTEAEFPSWAADLDRLASLPNTRCKISGLMSEAPQGMRTVDGLRPWVEHAIRSFGADRCAYGSDWPVLTSVSTYTVWLDMVRTIVGTLPDDEQAAILGLNALAIYDPTGRKARVKESTRGAH